jgi:hypothetical protein
MRKKKAIIPDSAYVWAELWMEPNGEINFKFHTKLPFLRSKKAMERFEQIIQERLNNAKQCPFHEEEP